MVAEGEDNILVAGLKRTVEKHGPDPERPGQYIFSLMAYTITFWDKFRLSPCRGIFSRQTSPDRNLACAMGEWLLKTTVPLTTAILIGPLDFPTALFRYARCTAEVAGERRQQNRNQNTQTLP